MSVKNKDILATHGNKLLKFCQERFGFEKEPNIIFLSDKDNYHELFGKTAYYDPQNENIVVYITGRHPKDILRSLAHEIVHHDQNSRGELFSQETLGPGYAQNNSHMREMEREAYEKGNLAFRDYEDILKYKKQGETVMIERNLKKAIQALVESKLLEGKMPQAAIDALNKKRGGSSQSKGKPEEEESTPRGGQPGAPEPAAEAIEEAAGGMVHDLGTIIRKFQEKFPAAAQRDPEMITGYARAWVQAGKPKRGSQHGSIIRALRKANAPHDEDAPEPITEECIDEMCGDPTHDHEQSGVEGLAAKAMAAVAALAAAGGATMPSATGPETEEPPGASSMVIEDELEESYIRTPEQEKSFHSRLFGSRLVALNAKLMSNFIKK